MAQKTRINAEEGKQELFITREFDLPVDLLFKAHTEAELIEQWMGNKVLALENKKQGVFHFETKDKNGNILFSAVGVIHDFTPDKQIVRTFEMVNTPFPVQLEFLTFDQLSKNTSRLTMQVIYKSVQDRDSMLKLPFAFGINNAHNKLQEVAGNLT